MPPPEELTVTHTRRLIRASDADLSSSSFANVNLSAAVFDDVNLSNASIQNANLSNVHIADANTSGMTINGVLVSDLQAAFRASLT